MTRYRLFSLAARSDELERRIRRAVEVIDATLADMRRRDHERYVGLLRQVCGEETACNAAGTAERS